MPLNGVWDDSHPKLWSTTSMRWEQPFQRKPTDVKEIFDFRRLPSVLVPYTTPYKPKLESAKFGSQRLVISLPSLHHNAKRL